jgi:hypothetical protein
MKRSDHVALRDYANGPSPKKKVILFLDSPDLLEEALPPMGRATPYSHDVRRTIGIYLEVEVAVT